MLTAQLGNKNMSALKFSFCMWKEKVFCSAEIFSLKRFLFCSTLKALSWDDSLLKLKQKTAKTT